ncbi:ATP-binding protein [Actinospica durhamensis]|uniref:ATP-binding protein n=1 Tax=Actinospica durhamensis TaxID=1508375 RepID=A0A941EWL6_9ACTN|nr:ATP-binding protein [Actinospica durhamensis]MBR7838296.1 ATP-binding protein [Actinospica durhamensis]
MTGVEAAGSAAAEEEQAPDGVSLRFAPLPEHVRTARLVAVALARRAGVEDGLLDEVRLAVGEACSRAVGLHRSVAPGEPVLVRFAPPGERFRVEVADLVTGGPVPKQEDGGEGESGGESAGFDPHGGTEVDMGLAVLRGLVDDLEVETVPAGGVIRMGWPVQHPDYS